MRHILLVLFVIVLLILALSGCKSVYKCPTYSYMYKDIRTGDTLYGRDWVPYLPGDTVVFYPEGREIVILTTKVGNTILK